MGCEAVPEPVPTQGGEKKISLAGSLTCRSGSDLILPLQAPLTRGLDLIVKTSFDA